MINNLKNITACILVSMVLLLILTESSAQDIPFGHFSVQEGLSNSFVNCLLQDRTGFLWFGTANGLNRFVMYQIPSISQVSLKVYDLLGREVTELVNEEMSAGSYEVNFDASQLSSGIYFYRIQASSFVETKKMILLR